MNRPADGASGRIEPFVTVYLTYYLAWGIHVPYFNDYLRTTGTPAWEIAVLSGLVPLMQIIAPPYWGRLVDVRGGRRNVLSLLFALTAAMYIVLVARPAGAGMYAAVAAYGTVSTAIGVLMDALVLRTVRRRYHVVRATGTFAFFVTAALGGVVIERFGHTALLMWFPMLMGAAALLVQRCPDAGAHERDLDAPRGPAALGQALMKMRSVGLGSLLLFGWFHWIAMVQYHAFFTVALRERLVLHGVVGEGRIVGAAWALSTVGEFVFFLASDRILRTVGIVPLYAAVVGSSLLRWLIYAADGPWWGPVLAQVLHTTSFGAFHIANARIVAALAPPAWRNRFQTTYGAVVLGAGGLAGGLMGAWLLRTAPTGYVWWLAFAADALGAVPLVWFLLRRRPARALITA